MRRRVDVPPFDPKTAMKPGRTYSNTQAEDMIHNNDEFRAGHRGDQVTRR